MKVFLSWSGERSKNVAEALRAWLPDVIQDIVPWMSAADIQAGSRWNRRVQEELSESRFGIICLTPENQTALWILFEAGALAKTIEDTFVCPYLIDLEPSEILQGPLTQFQAKKASEPGTFDLLKAINRASKENALADDKLKRAFKRCWPELSKTLQSLPEAERTKVQRSTDEMIEEILVAVQDIKRGVGQAETPAYWSLRKEPTPEQTRQAFESKDSGTDLACGSAQGADYVI
jgi:hypothetical protein